MAVFEMTIIRRTAGTDRNMVHCSVEEENYFIRLGEVHWEHGVGFSSSKPSRGEEAWSFA